jgi:4-hydroxy-2-oxoglutarate aldolase
MKLKGVFPPIPTPFAKRKASADKMAFNVTKWNEYDLAGYVVLGSNGENVLLSEPEALEMVEVVSEQKSKDKLLIAGTGKESAKETIRFTVACHEKGADAALVVTPSYYKPKMNSKALKAFFTLVADNVPIPVLIYHVPAYTGVTIDAELVFGLSQHPNIVGIKDSSANMGLIGEIVHRVPGNFSVLVGSGSALLSALVCKASGGILALANIAPKKCVEIYNLVLDGKINEARKVQLPLIRLNKAVTAQYGVPALKYALDQLGYFGGQSRNPLLPLNSSEKEEISRLLAQAGLLP